MKNERLLSILMFIAIFAVGFFLLQQCQGRQNQGASTTKLHPAVTLERPLPEAVEARPVSEARPTDPNSPPTPQAFVIGGASKDSPFKLAVTVNTVTAGVDLVQLNIREYAETVQRKQPLTLVKAQPGLLKPLSLVQAHVTLGGKVLNPDALSSRLDAWVWRVGPAPRPAAAAPVETAPAASSPAAYAPAGAPAEVPAIGPGRITLHTILYENDEAARQKQPFAYLERVFSIDEPNGYDLTVTTNVISATDREFTIAIDQITSTDLPKDNVQFDNRVIHAAKYSAAGRKVTGEGYFDYHATQAKAGTTELGALNGAGDRVLWVAHGNRFFTAVARPLPRDGSTSVLTLETGRTVPSVEWVGSAEANTLKLAAKVEESPVGVRLVGAPVNVAARSTTALPIRAFLGPKEPKFLEGNKDAPQGTEPYVKFTAKYEELIRYSQGGPCGFCTFSWLVKPILWLLDVIHAVVRNYGIAIIVLVIVVRLLLHPLTRMSQVSMAKMQKSMAAIKPELDKVKKKYEKDPQQLRVETMKVYRENNVNPAGGVLGCLPMLIQMPIWLALYAGLAADIHLRHAPFIPGWINDLSNPDTVWHFTPFTLPMLGQIEGLNLLPLLLAVLFFVQMRVTMKTSPPPADPQQAQTQKISQWMILLFPLFLYLAPSGLNLYIFASTIGGLFDTWIIRKSLRKQGILPPVNPKA